MKGLKTKTILETCPSCNGSGKVEYSECGRGCCGPYTFSECDHCNGKGKIKQAYKQKVIWEKK